MKIKKLLKKIEKKKEASTEDMLLLANALFDLAEHLGYEVEVSSSDMQSIDINYFPSTSGHFEIENLAKTEHWRIEGERKRVLR